MFKSARRPRLKTLAALVLVASCTSCGLFGDDGDSQAADIEQETIRVSVIPTMDVAPLHLAVKDGLFEREGLNVQIVDAKSGQDGLTKLTAGDVDISYGGYVPFFVAQNTGAADLKFVADASSANPNTVVIAAMPDSDVRSVRDLGGKRIAINGVNGVSDTLTKSTMKTNGIDFNDVEWVTLGFPEMAGALASGEVDAAFLTEPFITQASKSTGIIPIADTAKGPTLDLPIGGYGSLSTFTEANPNTIAAFQRVMQRATLIADDRSKIEPILVESSKLDADTAALATLPKLGSSLDGTRLQRVPDLLEEFDILNAPIDAERMIFTSPQ